jgi:hypothetical protein
VPFVKVTGWFEITTTEFITGQFTVDSELRIQELSSCEYQRTRKRDIIILVFQPQAFHSERGIWPRQ